MCHVLLIEDEILIALDLQDLLEAHGAKTFAWAATEKSAILAANKQKPDFIISDVLLAEGFGPSAVEVILRDIGPIPVVFITATPEKCHPCAPPGKILRKPFSHAEIVSIFKDRVLYGH